MSDMVTIIKTFQVERIETLTNFDAMSSFSSSDDTVNPDVSTETLITNTDLDGILGDALVTRNETTRTHLLAEEDVDVEPNTNEEDSDEEEEQPDKGDHTSCARLWMICRQDLLGIKRGEVFHQRLHPQNVFWVPVKLGFCVLHANCRITERILALICDNNEKFASRVVSWLKEKEVVRERWKFEKEKGSFILKPRMLFGGECDAIMKM